MFVAIKGERRDGHDFVAHAFERGAIVALVERSVVPEALTVDLRAEPPNFPGRWSLPVQLLVDDSVQAMQVVAAAWREHFPVRVIGITGSVGKSSTKELAHAVLSQRYRTFKTPGNRNSVLGLPAALFQLRPYHQRAVLEMGMYTTGEIARLCEISRPEIGVVTMIDPVHMERAGSLEQIVAAKQELVEALPADGVAILNQDEPLVMGMAAHTAARVFTYGLDPQADLWADEIESMGLDGMRFTLHHDRAKLRTHVPLLGRHSVHTALRAAAVGVVEGLTWEEIMRGLRDEAAQLRLLTARGPADSLILDDTYNASPASVIAALNLLADLQGRRIAVLGDMLELGTAEEESHRLVGRRARRVADVLLTVGPRGRLIAEEALHAGMPRQRVLTVDRAEEAIPLLEQTIEAGDVVLVKGSRGVALDQVVAALAHGRDQNQYQ
jgi:UDP-N-acetylmuramoyl-tripeptide--D-alanyl-D-alanine ligase